ncbi:hypothetical protein OGAPHI_004112 [Ogataea philodendri]|uniref:V-type ATPase assembly factor PKR1 n=1 Tax=Ogataea philodendri TaxID=1378263 RepID=A0A9P8P5K8_9ASCO|nr:uncharacterized protein OGAPHI_004112 [Ogataea philodendri]KAH3665923.1 hypothetical protein OGAPHI_004112 [Ogataea philodendri]
MSFIADLWDSVFQPGTTPTLVAATHISFACLIISLVVMIFLSRSIHFVNLLVISLLLWGSVTWFIGEIAREKAKLQQEGSTDKQDAPKEPSDSKKEK